MYKQNLEDTKSELRRFNEQNPEFRKETKELLWVLKDTNVSEDIELYLQDHIYYKRRLEGFRDFERNNEKSFVVMSSREMDGKIRLAETDIKYRDWLTAMQSMPNYTSKLPFGWKDDRRNYEKLWNLCICGNKAIFELFLDQKLSYEKTGIVKPLLLIGPSRSAKTFIAEIFANMLGVSMIPIAPGSSVVMHRGLTGIPMYDSKAGVGAIAEAMIKARTGNPMIFVEDLDRAYTGINSFETELKTILKGKCQDNYLGVELNVRHVPFVFAATDKEKIREDLRDLMIAVNLETITEKNKDELIKEYILPCSINVMYGKEHDKKWLDTMQDELGQDFWMNKLIDLLWEKGVRSVRCYEEAINMYVRKRYLSEREQKDTLVSEDDIERIGNYFSD